MTDVRTTSPNRAMSSLLLAMALMLTLSLLFTRGGNLAAQTEDADLAVRITKNAYWYQPDGTVHLNVTVDNASEDSIDDVTLRARVYSSYRYRSELDQKFSGDLDRYYLTSRVLERDTALQAGINSYNYQLSLGESGFPDGVYPLAVQVIANGELIGSAVTELIIYSPARAEGSTPLKLAMVFDTLEPAYWRPDGYFKDNLLARECSTANGKTGWYATLVSQMAKWGNLRFSISLSPLLLEEMEDMADGYTVKSGKKEEKYGSDSRNSVQVASVVTNLRQMAQDPRFQFLSTPYASPDLERLVSLGWAEDASRQISTGLKELESGLSTTIDSRYFYPPAVLANSSVLGELGPRAGDFVLVSPELLQRSRTGTRLLRGLTLSNPVELDDGDPDRRVLGLFVDDRSLELVDMLTVSQEPHFIAQVILAELTNLYLERPAMDRACVFLWPNRWQPPEQVVEEVLAAIAGAPWLHSVLAEECFTVPPIENVVLEIPEAESEEDDYFVEVGRARNRFLDFEEVVLEDNRLLPLLEKDLYITESVAWEEWNREKEGLEYATMITSIVDDQLSRITIPDIGTITLTSEKAEIPVSVVNGNNYELRANLSLESNGLSFPDGDLLEVTLEPKENLFEIPVEVEIKGKVRFHIRLESERLVLSELEITVRTGRFNTFAVILVGTLLGLIGLVWLIKAITRRKVGKHKKRQVERIRSGQAET